MGGGRFGQVFDCVRRVGFRHSERPESVGSSDCHFQLGVEAAALRPPRPSSEPFKPFDPWKVVRVKPTFRAECSRPGCRGGDSTASTAGRANERAAMSGAGRSAGASTATASPPAFSCAPGWEARIPTSTSEDPMFHEALCCAVQTRAISGRARSSLVSVLCFRMLHARQLAFAPRSSLRLARADARLSTPRDERS